MGASYQGDWNSKCTHLIAAFANTPKVAQVKAVGGIIAVKEWLEESHRQRKRLPWRRFALKKEDQGEESEEEILEESAHAASEAMADDCDTDEEIEKIQQEEAKRKTAIENNDTYDMDTDEEIEQIKKG